MDSILSLAHTLTEDMRCPGCGMPKHEAYNPDSAGWYEVRDTTCNGCAAVSKDADRHKDSDHDPARKVWVVDERPPDMKLKPWSPDGGV